MNYFFILYIFYAGMVSLIVIRKHLFLCLISLEFIVLSLLFMILLYCMMFENSLYIFVVFMTFYVCEGVLGLSVLVYMIRCFGNDYLNSMVLL
uniref:NADH-ubiquinone oxidoreductase chain 4L n=1 Tax=Sophonia nigrilineata TaxID=3092776 RepID=A0AAF1BVI3_9HEMI|nr:NADH dehydrogenase subunit 4L [Sophonia nigrilineata]WPC85230.1 NADH dehydrogenase subunit 4L [Sophonia nigrilineata]